MIYYLFIIIAVLLITAQFSFTKIFANQIEQTTATVMVMLVFTSSVGALLFLIINGFQIEFSMFSFVMAFAFGTIMVFYFVIGVKVLSLGSLAVYSMFMMLGGMIVPFIYGILFLIDCVTVGKVIGCFVLAGFMIMQTCVQKSESTDKGTKKKRILFIFLCLVIFFINGSVSVISKAHQINAAAISEKSFTFLSCSITVVEALLFLVFKRIFSVKSKLYTEIKQIIKTKPVLIMVALGIVMHIGNFLLLIAAAHIPASIQFPMISGGAIFFSAIVSLLFFKEKIPKLEMFAVIGAFLSTFLFLF